MVSYPFLVRWDPSDEQAVQEYMETADTRINHCGVCGKGWDQSGVWIWDENEKIALTREQVSEWRWKR